MKLSRFGQKLTAQSGIVELMDDLGTALRVNPDMLFMGGGNPADIESVSQCFQSVLKEAAADSEICRELLGVYQAPQGDDKLLSLLADYLNDHYGWSLSTDNIAITNGSQSAFFVLFNMFAGLDENGRMRHIQLPLTPEYLGYADTGIDEDLFVANKPVIELLEDNQFKYRVDFDHLSIPESTAALCVSRPTNPTGNVITDGELAQLDALAKQNDIPLIIDGAYGVPFPNIVFTEASPIWNDNIILVLSLSKLGLPGARTGIVIANEKVIQAFSNINTILSLASGNLGPVIARSLLAENRLESLCKEEIQPFYHKKVQQCLAWVSQYFEGIPYRVHKPEGAIFIWLWFEGLPIRSQALYDRLKEQGVLVISGHHFFPGLTQSWSHKDECLRLNYSQDSDIVEEGIKTLAKELRLLYNR